MSEQRRGSALTLVMGGLIVSWVVGVPLGALIGDVAGWRVSFVVVAVLGALALGAIWAWLPNLDGTPAVSLRSRLAVARRPDVLMALLVTLIGQTAIFVPLTYVRPLLDAVIGGDTGVVALLAVFGVAGIGGTALGGAAADRLDPTRALAVVLLLLTVTLLSFVPLVALAGTPIGAVAATGAIIVWGVAGFAFPLLQQHRLITMAPSAQDETLSLNASAIYLGQGIGAAVGSVVLAHAAISSLGWVAGGLAVIAAVVLRTSMNQ